MGKVTRNQIVYVIFFISLLGILIAWGLGKRDDMVFQEDSNRFSEAEYKINNGNFSEAEGLLSSLLVKYPNNTFLLVDHAICLAAMKKYDSAIIALNKAKRQRPFLVNDDHFLIQYGQDLFHLGQYANAQKYLMRAKQFNTSPELIGPINNLLSEITNRQ